MTFFRSFSTVSLVVALAACASESTSTNRAVEPVDPPDELGAFAVGHTQFSPVDASRDDRPLLVDVWYPVAPEDAEGFEATTYPLAGPIGLDSAVAVEEAPAASTERRKLLVFSHGFEGINTASVGLMEMLASHGFVVASPEHTGNAQSSDPADEFDIAAANRVPDVSFVIDTMLSRSEDAPDLLSGLVDPDDVGVVGHSFGGMTALGMAAGWAGAAADSRVGAIAPISAVIDAELQRDERTGPNAGFTAEQLAGITVPTMLVAGSEDIDVFPENNGFAFDAITSSPRVYKLDILGANHTHFANVCDIGNLLLDLEIDQSQWPALGAEELLEPYETTCTGDAFPIAEVNRLQNIFVVSFFARHLRDQAGYDDYLDPAFAATEPAAELLAK